MKKLLVLGALLAMTSYAYAQYDIDNKNIINDVDTITSSDIGTDDYIKVYSVSNTTTGYGEAEKLRLVNAAPYAKTLTAVTTLTDADCNKTIFLNSATEFATTLPALEAGCKFKFFVKAAPSGASYTVVTASGANVMIGGAITLTSALSGVDYISDGDTITFVDGSAVVGDWAEVMSDGTSWYVSGSAKVNGGITLTSS